MPYLEFKEIPSDLQEMIYEEEHAHGNYSQKFEKAMFKNGLMEYGHARRSHRIMTKKCINLDYWGTVELLTGLTQQEVIASWEKENTENMIREMFITAKEHGYVIIEKDLKKYL